MPAYSNMREAEATHRANAELQSLQIQARMKRVKTSETIRELVEFVNREYRSDRLLFPDKDNPFKPKKICTIL